MKHKKNRGVALITVILAMAIVMVLGASILYAAYTGLVMRETAKTSANTFYDAESVLNEIVAGIENDMSEQYINAYTKVMTNYGNIASVSEMNSGFRSEFVLNMVDVFHVPAVGATPADDTKYSTAKLAAYIKDGYGEGTTWSVSFDSTRTGGNMMETLEDGLVLRNVKVDFQKGNYKNSITTDIKIGIPEVYFAKIASMPEITDYTYIADQGVDVTTGVTLTLNGSAYSGNTKASDGTGSSNSLLLNAGATMDASNSSLLIANGDIVVQGGAALATGSSDTTDTKITTLWAENLSAQRSSTGTTDAKNTVSLLGRSYISDDITLDGAGNSLTLGGQVFLYSSGTDSASNSSALVINGTSSTLDMSALDTFIVAGNAFVKASSVDSGKDDTENEDIITGDSVALKANQYVYMVPSECRGITTNPMSYTQYNTLIKDADWKSTALSTTLSSLNRSISSYGDVDIVPVFNANEGGTVYLYLEFSDASEASLYFMDVYESNSSMGTKVRSYMDNYLAGVKFNADTSGSSNMTRLLTNGNYLAPAYYSTSSNKWVAEYANDTNSSGAVSQELGTYAKNYEALCTKLVTNSNSLSTAETGRTVFNNLVDVEKINNTTTVEADSLMEIAGAAGTTLEGATCETVSGVGTKVIVEATDGSGIQAIIVDNANSGTFTVSSADTTLKGKGIIIATGDVTVSRDWDGVILCGGKLNIIGNVELTSDASAATTAMKLTCKATTSAGAESEFAVLNVFRGGEDFALTSSSSDPNANDTSDIRNCIAYENWSSN